MMNFKRPDTENQSMGTSLRKNIIIIGLLSLVASQLSLAFEGEYDTEINKLQNIIAQDPTNLDATYRLGNYLAWDRRYEEALKVFQEILVKESEYKDAEIGIARVYAWMGDQENSIKKYQEMLSKYPKNFEAYQGLGLLALWNNDFERSIDYFKKALDINPKDIGSLKGIGRAYLGRGDRRNADIYFTRAQILEIKKAPLLTILAIVAGVIFLMIVLFFWIRFRSRRRKKAILRLELKVLRYALFLYHQQNSKFPLALENILEEKWRPPGGKEEKPYLEEVCKRDRGFLVDPFGKRYWYNPDTGGICSTTKGCDEW